jgi:hypothetical protein
MVKLRMFVMELWWVANNPALGQPTTCEADLDLYCTPSHHIHRMVFLSIREQARAYYGLHLERFTTITYVTSVRSANPESGPIRPRTALGIAL